MWFMLIPVAMAVVLTAQALGLIDLWKGTHGDED